MKYLALLVVASVTAAAAAQTIPTTNTTTPVTHSGPTSQIVGDDVQPNIQASWNSSDNGTMALRAPGRLVTAARSDFTTRHAAPIQDSRFGPTIDAEEPAISPGKALKVQVIKALFDNFNTTLIKLIALIGLPTDNTGGGTGGTDTTGLGDLLGTITSPA